MNFPMGILVLKISNKIERLLHLIGRFEKENDWVVCLPDRRFLGLPANREMSKLNGRSWKNFIFSSLDKKL